MSVNQNTKTNIGINIFSSSASKSIVWILSFAVITAVGAQISVPVKPVPFTLQTMMVVLAGAFLGSKNGAYSQLVYLTMGAIGLPVFAPDGVMGFARLLGPTGGYLLAFPLAAYITGYFIEKNKSYINVVFSMFVGNVLILLIGAVYLDAIFIHNISESLKIGAVIFSLWTVLKVLAGASIYFGLRRN
ncbi:MAG: biotin transporter BioY [Ignavibacteriaceae bacterium]